MKIIKLFLISILFFNCESPDKVTITKEEYKQLKGDTSKPEYPKSFHFYGRLADWRWEIILGQDSHEYLTNNGYHAFAFIHYPDCRKCKKDTSCKN